MCDTESTKGPMACNDTMEKMEKQQNLWIHEMTTEFFKVQYTTLF